MIATRKLKTEPTEGHLVLSGISWDAYEAIGEAIGERPIRMTYDEGELEIMTLSFGHENAGRWIGKLISILAMEWDIPLCSGGSTTLKKSLVEKGLESDECFWVAHESDMRGKKKWNVLKDPPPDLAVEIDVTHSSLNRLGIYAALQIPEVWRYDGSTFNILILGKKGEYKKKTKSRAFPTLPMKEFVGFVERLGTEDESRVLREFQDWLRGNSGKEKGGNLS